MNKKIITSLIMMMGAVALFANGQVDVASDWAAAGSEQASITIDAADFNQLFVDGVTELIITQGSDYSINVTGDRESLSALNTVNEDGLLTIISPVDEYVYIEISMPELTFLKSNESMINMAMKNDNDLTLLLERSILTSSDLIKAHNVDMTVLGHSQVQLGLDAVIVNLNQKSGDVALSGNTAKFFFDVTGSSNLETSDFWGTNGQLAVQGTSTVNLDIDGASVVMIDASGATTVNSDFAGAVEAVASADAVINISGDVEVLKAIVLAIDDEDDDAAINIL